MVEETPEATTASSTLRGLNTADKIRICTWNVNGLRAVGGRRSPQQALSELLDSLGCDVTCFQETKTDRSGLNADFGRPAGYHSFFAFCTRHKAQSYSGTATFVKNLPVLAAATCLDDASFFPDGLAGAADLQGLSAERVKQLDCEGRTVVTDHGYFVLFNVYCPCAPCGEEEKAQDRLKFKADFQEILSYRLKQQLQVGRRVILVGDLNTMVSPLDCAWEVTDAHMLKSKGTPWIRGLLQAGFVDSFRFKCPDETLFTCWSTQTGARETNYGTRIDYILTDLQLAKSIESCNILTEEIGSDHCPVVATLSLTETLPFSPIGKMGSSCPPLCSCYFRELAGSQSKLSSFFEAYALPATSTAVALKPALKPPTPVSNRLRQAKLSFAPRTRNRSESLPNPSTALSSEVRDRLHRESQEKWKSIFTDKKPSVKCTGHNDPAVLRTVAKSGKNCGRKFWACDKPAGRSDDPNARCNFFQWADGGFKEVSASTKRPKVL
jgi:AP endonuclease-2